MRITILLISLLGFLCDATSQTTILDFETEETSTTFQYFASDLEATTNAIIDNPDPSGINTSAKVADFKKPANSESFAGAFATTAIIPIDLTTSAQICMKVWFENPGNVALKLEMGTSANWVTTQQVTETNQWTEICFDSNDNSEEDPRQPATGGVYNQMVLFFDFGEVLTEERNYFFDDVIVNSGTLEPADVTFSVDMNNYPGTFTEVFVSGTFNNFSDIAELLSDDDGDGVYTGTVTDIAPGAHEYLYQVDNFAVKEEFNRTFPCVITDESGDFSNRSLFVTEDVSLETVCWESCYTCDGSVDITINVAAGPVITVSPDGLFVAGGTGFGLPGDNPLTDDDGDGIYSITVEREIGFSSFYTFTNGACLDYSCKEVISGQDCADPNNFNDRFLPAVTSDTEISTCFGVCSESTDCSGANISSVTFTVDMSDYTESFDSVFVTGNFVNWVGNANPMTDLGNGRYSTTLDFLPGDYEYKFRLHNDNVEENFAGGEPCTITDGSGIFTNRLLTVDSNDQNVCFFYETCNACMTTSVGDLDDETTYYNIFPTVTSDMVQLKFYSVSSNDREIMITNTTGQLTYKSQVSNTIVSKQIDVSAFDKGIHYVSVNNDGIIVTKKIVIL